MSFFLVVLVGGIAQGAVFSLVGLAFSSLYATTRTVNLAIGDMVMVGSVVTAATLASDGRSFLLPILLIFCLVGLVALTYKVVGSLRKRRADGTTIVVALLGVALLVQGSVGGLTRFQQQRLPRPYVDLSLDVGGARISGAQVGVIVTMIVLSLAYWAFESRTRWGLIFRAMGNDEEIVQLVGISTRRVLLWSVTVSTVIALIAGLMLAPLIAPSANMGVTLLIGGFVAATVGGLGSPYGALIGGLCVGIVRGMAQGYINPGSAELATFALLLGLLAFRPAGIFASRGQVA